MPWTPEEAKEAGRKGGKNSGKTRRRQRRMRAEEKARDALRAVSPDMADELVQAAKGEGTYKDLGSRERLHAVVKVLEYGLGRPATEKPKEADKEPEGGLRIE